MKKISPRIKDVICLAAVISLSIPITYCINLNINKELSKLPPFLDYLWLLALAFICLFSYLESRDKDPFVTGKTQRMGVANSFTASLFLLGFNYSWSRWALSALLLCTCIFVSRELGRCSNKKREKKYLGQSGILLSDLPNKAKAEINGKKVTVWSKNTIKAGTPIYISEIKATYLYVSPAKDKENF